VIHRIPDFRLLPDPYIGIEEDRMKAAHLFEASKTRNFRQLLDYYYSVTKEDPGDLAALWTAHALAETEIADSLLREAGIGAARNLLDVGCSTGGMLIAAHSRFEALAGVDVALRWLMIGAVRLREAGVIGSLVCANAEALPFANDTFDAITCIDTVEHLRDAGLAMREMYRVASANSIAIWATNNRFAALPDPQVHLWGVGWLPRSRQADYVAWRRSDLHRYQIQMRSAREMDRLVRDARFSTDGTKAAPLIAPHRPGLRFALGAYNRIRSAPWMRLIGPRLWTIGRKNAT
jgi:ubiquinone/menaquinone biosynthesis C-methylase UbiE